MPSIKRLQELTTSQVLDEDGNTIQFRQVYPDWPDMNTLPPPHTSCLESQTVAFFIRAIIRR